MNFPIFGRKPPSLAQIAVFNDACLRAGIEPRSRVFASHGMQVGPDGLPVQVQSKEQIREILRDAGLSKRAAEKVAKAGWRAIKPDDQRQRLIDSLEAATARIRAAIPASKEP